MDSKLEGSCPTVDEELGLELIKEIESYHLDRRARLAVLKGEGNIGNLDANFVKELEALREMFPEMPSELLARVLPSGRGYNEGNLPWNRHQRRKLRKAQQVVVHLFSGKDTNFWKKELEDHRRAVLCLDNILAHGLLGLVV